MCKFVFNIIILIFSLFLLPVQAQNVHRSKSGIIIYGEKGLVRALEPFNGVATGGDWLADAINQYPRKLSGVKVYCMVIPTAVEFYCPSEASAWTKPEKPVIDNIYKHLSDSVTHVNVYDVLSRHKTEPIYSRTDHHWTPWGAYYAAGEFAKVANVPFPNLESYDKHVIHSFVGSMYHFSRDISVKQSPEDFVYYVPRDSSYTTTYIDHRLGTGRKVIGITEPFEGKFFITHHDGSPSSYSTFMGGDLRTTHVHTHVGNGRRLLIIKDSYGNALPGYLFSSFEDIYVIDFRYFTKNVVSYAKEKGITDLLFANNLQHAYAKSTARAYVRLLNQ